MAKVNKLLCKSDSRHHRVAPYPLSTYPKKARKEGHRKMSHSKALEKKDWEGATCPVCLEFPHNAVLLLCSSYHKGCRPYMCATSQRFSNCLDQYKKTYTKVSSTEQGQQLIGLVENSSFGLDARHANEKTEVPELLCPLCRGQVKGWTVVEPARKYLNGKKRTCMQNKCSFVGTYKELRKHVKAKHPLARPRAVDPVLEEKWKKLECERERNDVISTITSSTPGAMVLGDYVIEPGYHGIYSDYDSDDSLDGGYFPMESFDQGQNRGLHWQGRYRMDYDSSEEDFGMRYAYRRLIPRIVVGQSRRQWRHRGGNGR
ncbi:uncharacterized protein LOC123229869 [Mangifera indica]|uniref:uncharacterized protein LOC123229869 n=1 Tax=Mangifera indica TaxID=29780 RepID=UPI001CFBAA27|nr:uncharacterized protein LOC123229869 [Mangifera indica]XP_044511802.1 uncharacterized protein LOC123229869 [Mangifera indica]XP_044511803.1 uncharacterized protein LOC123229869 [Mangifera indica]XP_044511804.1 uncharacterized protein LOC123229869 [Mangifera indica]